MIVKFDKFRRLEIPQLTLCSPNGKNTDGALSEVVGTLVQASDIEMILNFNTSSELNFSYPLAIEDNDSIGKSLYESIQGKRQVYAEGFGFFCIKSVSERITGKAREKEVSAISCDIEIGNKKLPFIADGTYGIMEILQGIIMPTLPKWTLGAVVDSLLTRNRTFEDVDAELDVLTFFMKNMQDAYECIFQFDFDHRVISVYDQNNFAIRTTAFLSHDTVIKNLTVSENVDGVYTALSVHGDNELNIISVNPLGTNVIYDFSFYKSWMSADLQSKLTAWEDSVASLLQEYYDKNLQAYQKFDDLENEKLELERRILVHRLYGQLKTNLVSEESTGIIDDFNVEIVKNGGTAINNPGEFAPVIVAEINSRIAEMASSISDLEAIIATLEEEFSAMEKDVAEMRDSVAIANFFTQDEYDELSSYISEGKYSDEFITVTDSMTSEEWFLQAKQLFDRAVNQMKRISQPMYEFSVDSSSFIFAEQFAPISEQLDAGSIVSVEIREDDVAELFLTAFSLNYTDKKISFTFGNRYNRYDNKSLYEDVLGSINKSANTVEYLKNEIFPFKGGSLKSIQQQIQDLRNLTKSKVLSSKDEETIIDEAGIWLRKSDGNFGFDPEQMRLIHNAIVYSDDGFNTAKMAISKIPIAIMEDGSTRYIFGVNAEAIVGELLIGGQLNINFIENGQTVRLLDSINSIRQEVNRYIIADDRGLIIGRNIPSATLDGGDSFIMNLTEKRLQFLRNNQPALWIDAEDNIVHTRGVEAENRISVGSDAFGGYFDISRTQAGMKITVRGGSVT